MKYINISKSILLSSCCAIITSWATENTFQLKLGDLLFQDTNCGEFCDSINSATTGYHKAMISHVAMVVNLHPEMIIEANTHGVSISKLNQFLQTSLDNESNPRVMVGRLTKLYQPLIPSAIQYAMQQVNKPYNQTFIANNESSFYCSELIERSFYFANHNHPVFQQVPMNFKDNKTQQISPIWLDYFSQLNESTPQGKLGTNPGFMSQESIINIIHYYGELRTTQ